MIWKMFSVRDNRVEAFLPTFAVRAQGEASRSFETAVKTADHQFAKNKADYVLYQVGEFDDIAGMFLPSEPVRIMSGLEVEDIPF